jgi:hypothetical protein
MYRRCFSTETYFAHLVYALKPILSETLKLRLLALRKLCTKYPLCVRLKLQVWRRC